MPILIVGALAIYMIIMAFVNIDTLTVHHLYARYFGSLAFELVLLVVLYFVLTRRDKLKREREEELKRIKDGQKDKSDEK